MVEYEIVYTMRDETETAMHVRGRENAIEMAQRSLERDSRIARYKIWTMPDTGEPEIVKMGYDLGEDVGIVEPDTHTVDRTVQVSERYELEPGDQIEVVHEAVSPQAQKLIDTIYRHGTEVLMAVDPNSDMWMRIMAHVTDRKEDFYMVGGRGGSITTFLKVNKDMGGRPKSSFNQNNRFTVQIKDQDLYDRWLAK